MPHPCFDMPVTPGLRAFSSQAENLAESANLDLLRQVDKTVDNLTRLQNTLRDQTALAEFFVELLNTKDIEEEVDPNGIIENALVSAQRSLSSLTENLKARRRAAEQDHTLNGHHEDAVVTAYTEAIRHATELFDSLERLRMVAREYDADAGGEDSRQYTDAAALIAALDEE